VKICFEWKADLVILFLNKSSGSFTCACFLPIYFGLGKFLQNAGKALAGKGIEKSIALHPRHLKNIQKLSESVESSFFDLAIRIGYWKNEYYFGVLSE